MTTSEVSWNCQEQQEGVRASPLVPGGLRHLSVYCAGPCPSLVSSRAQLPVRLVVQSAAGIFSHGFGSFPLSLNGCQPSTILPARIPPITVSHRPPPHTGLAEYQVVRD